MLDYSNEIPAPSISKTFAADGDEGSGMPLVDAAWRAS
jgi:hypothetical protein